ncbi:methyltransferase domain-containing protein [Leucobacter coleopterorum]|uniref:Methyltransferase domain-containing protein n=1 Tax=Leucobacter coleopterorum TaxID=2714933 RepID=A0ABX6K229_9MICO|nr:methyltransferase domain-containing protein [Leucobacter coleopterorum]QIM19169.1 methyltransferase domain-containing protein [Leucobacter coleopterorum]
MTLAVRDAGLRELMDDPACDPARLRRTLQRFGLVNRAVSCWDGVHRSQLRPFFAGLGRPARVLDIGCGGGDVLRRLVQLARRDGFVVEAVGIDPDPHAIAVAKRADFMPGVAYRQVLSQSLVQEGERFDAVISNHLLHHLDEVSLAGLLYDSEALSSGISLHSDIARGRVAYGAFALLAAPVAMGTFVWVDGLRSIRRSYTRAELAAVLPDGWRVDSPGTFRLLACFDHTSTHRSPSDRG